MPWTVLRPSFRSCQVEPLTCTSCCALPNLHLRAGLRCWIPRQPLFSSAYAPDEFSCSVWTFHRQAHVRQQSALLIFLWRTYSRINLCCRFIPLLAWLTASSMVYWIKLCIIKKILIKIIIILIKEKIYLFN